MSFYIYKCDKRNLIFPLKTWFNNDVCDEFLSICIKAVRSQTVSQLTLSNEEYIKKNINYKKVFTMKLNVGVLLSMIIVIHGAAIDKANPDDSISVHIIAPDSLFESAREYHNKLRDLQQDINEQLTTIRTAVSTVLKSSTERTLTQIESNAHQLLAQDQPARNAIFELSSSLCVNNLKVLLNSITEFTGFGSSNCVTSYDKSVQGALNSAYIILEEHEGTFADVQQAVVKAFIGKNVYLESDDIENRFVEQYNMRSEEWAAARPEVEEYVNTLNANIAGFNTVLDGCFTSLQDDAAPAYDHLQTNIEVCFDFDNTVDPFAIFRQ